MVNDKELQFSAYATHAPLRLKNRAYFVYLPDGYNRKFGMYIKFNDIVYAAPTNERILYSESKYNKDEYMDVNGNKSYACSFLHPQSGRTFFSFEDWVSRPWSQSDHDLNDLVFRIDNFDEIKDDQNRKITEISDDAISWIWAVEDLGSTDDFDFNDIVIKIQSITTNVVEKQSSDATEDETINTYKKITFTPLAAGGTLPTYIHWQSSNGKDYVLAPGIYRESSGTSIAPDAYVVNDLESLNVAKISNSDAVEYHQWFGNYPYTQMINTGHTSVRQSKISKCVIYLDSDFKLDCFGRPVDGMGKGLYISINGPTEGENTTEVDKERAADTNYNVAAPKIGAPAQMFIIFDNHWAWPVERTHITDAYPLFKDWAGDKKTDWTTERGKGDVIDRQY